MTYRYLPNLPSLAETEAWCAERGLVIVVADLGPDGCVRGLATADVDALAADLQVRAAELAERAIECAGALW